jgi:hypothetical protein
MAATGENRWPPLGRTRWPLTLESKHLSGAVSVCDDELLVRWLEDREDGYVNRTIGPRARAAARELSGRLQTVGGRHPWVQSVVVLWATFEQGTVDDRRVIWTDGARLADLLATQAPNRLGRRDIAQIADQVRATALALDRPARTEPAPRSQRPDTLLQPIPTETRHLGI